jgi:hypothetical protein
MVQLEIVQRKLAELEDRLAREVATWLVNRATPDDDRHCPPWLNQRAILRKQPLNAGPVAQR